jgi:SAM-dependent methyltransferase
MSEKRRATPIHMPTLNEKNEFEGGKRDYFRRLSILKDNIDFRNKNILDLGCSDGFFALSLAEEAKHVTAIEADADKISRCNKRKEQLGINNVDFYQRAITSELVEELPYYDVTIFMAVFHHMWNASKVYGVNTKTRKEQAKSIFASICAKTDVLAFELGDTKEEGDAYQTSWMSRKRQKEWVINDLFGSSFDNIKALYGPGYYRLPLGTRSLGMYALNRPITAKIFNRLYLRRQNIDKRDILRYIYIAR